ncbi:collagen-binding domain-containing protein [Corynebacterium neomassiliense]|uniref:collagen-binding domain-containing protein n=1 Tax=Corynebacterium neomassiliense TaxID=2079482 RepID=UPI0013872F7C|nr:collagen-binding domain-containing protein [Corynebacterium neomassiliense]
MAVSTGTAAAADNASINPFEVNNGFTIVGRGDVKLGNGELEGSVAAFKSLESTKSNYPVIHKAAGTGDYSVPKVDGVPVRILADSFVGNGSFDVSNRGAVDGSEAGKAVAKLVKTEGLEAKQRSNFVRLHRTAAGEEEGNIDLQAATPFVNDLSPYKAAQDTVASYFEALDTKVSQANKCLDSLYLSEASSVNKVTIGEEGGSPAPSGFSTDKPNVIEYGDLANFTQHKMKMAKAGGYKPTAAAPLIIHVPAGTTDLKLDFEGWDVGGADQELARYIMFDLSDVSGEVSITEVPLGAMWAPNSSLKFDSNTTTNGQWYSGSSVTAGPSAGEVHHHAFSAKLPCDTADEDAVPSIATSATVTEGAVDGADGKTISTNGGSITDTVTFHDLKPATEYTMAGQLVTAEGEETGIKGAVTFTTPPSTGGEATVDGTVAMEFKISGEQAAKYAGKSLVVLEALSLDGKEVATHNDAGDKAQTFVIAEQPGTTEPSEPGTTEPSEPGTTEPSEPGTTEPSEPGTTEPSEPGTTEPSEPGTTEPSEPGTTEPSEPGTTEPSEPGTTEPSEPVTGIEIQKKISGDKANEVKSEEDAAYDILLSWKDSEGIEQFRKVTVTPDTPVDVSDLPHGVEITLTEANASSSINGVAWSDIVWSGDGVVDEKGASRQGTVTLVENQVAKVTVENVTDDNDAAIIIPIIPTIPVAPVIPVNPVNPDAPDSPIVNYPEVDHETIDSDSARPSAGPESHGGGLANTGASVMGLGALAVILVGGGAWLVMRSRREA